AFAYCKNLKNVHLSEGLTEIGPRAFLCVVGTMKNFTSVLLPDSLESIGSQAFANVPIDAIKFKSDTSSRLRRLGDYCFQESNISGRLNLYTPLLNSWGASPFWGSTKLTSIFLYTNQVPDDFAVNNKNLLTGQGLSNRIKYYVPERLHEQYRTKWKVEYSVGGVGRTEDLNIYAIENIFSDKYSYEKKYNDSYGGDYLVLTNIFETAGNTAEIPETITIGTTQYFIKAIGPYVAGANITSVKFVNPGIIKVIGDYAFRYSENLADFCHKDYSGSRFEQFVNLERIGASAFEGTAVTRFIAPQSLNFIAEDAFFGCKSLSRVIISDKYFGENASEGNVSVMGRAFNSCPSLDSVVVGKKVNVIASNAFGNCKALSVFVMEHDVLPNFPAGGGSGTIGILGDSNSIVRIYASSRLIEDKNEKVQYSSFFSYKQYTFVKGYWDYAANSGNGGLVIDPAY
ncbi:MAG TPA: leucine-rich repeat domain-containing protein, partial [Clostridia bacterium]|nr:leucine-rich repeat domain-containing protein [Clostridia bacterium]